MVVVDDPANPHDSPEDSAALASYVSALLDALDPAVAGWVERLVRRRWEQWRGETPPPELLARAAAAGADARHEVLGSMRDLLRSDVDAQRSNPLSILRRAVEHPTRVLREAGVPIVHRDPDAERRFPDDVYDLSPASFSDVDPALHEPGVAWGAAKAHVVLARRRRA